MGYADEMELLPGGGPNVVATSFSANALAEAAEVLEEPLWRERAVRAAHWVAEVFLSEEGYFAYHGHSDRLVHNANLLGAALVHELAPSAPGAAEAVRVATARTLDAQLPDGTWPYGEAAGLEWVDGVHTGYVLDSLCRLEGVDSRIPEAIERGARFTCLISLMRRVARGCGVASAIPRTLTARVPV